MDSGDLAMLTFLDVSEMKWSRNWLTGWLIIPTIDSFSVSLRHTPAFLTLSSSCEIVHCLCLFISRVVLVWSGVVGTRMCRCVVIGRRERVTRRWSCSLTLRYSTDSMRPTWLTSTDDRYGQSFTQQPTSELLPLITDTGWSLSLLVLVFCTDWSQPQRTGSLHTQFTAAAVRAEWAQMKWVELRSLLFWMM